VGGGRGGVGGTAQEVGGRRAVDLVH
jgi:hypothetical protein